MPTADPNAFSVVDLIDIFKAAVANYLLIRSEFFRWPGSTFVSVFLFILSLLGLSSRLRGLFNEVNRLLGVVWNSQ